MLVLGHVATWSTRLMVAEFNAARLLEPGTIVDCLLISEDHPMASKMLPERFGIAIRMAMVGTRIFLTSRQDADRGGKMVSPIVKIIDGQDLDEPGLRYSLFDWVVENITTVDS